MCGDCSVTKQYCDVLGAQDTPFRFLLRFIYDFTSRHYNYLLQCALFTSVSSLYLSWSSDCRLLGCCSDRLLWSAPDVASLIGPFDLPLTLRLRAGPLIGSSVMRLWSAPLSCPWRFVSDRLLWSAPDVLSLIGSFDLPLTLRLWSAPLICPWRWVSDRLLWSAPDVASLIGSFDLPLTLRLWSVPLISSDVASLIGSFDLPLTLRLWAVPLICPFLSKSTLLSRSSRIGARTPCPWVVFRLQLSVG
jgi:hypothetical protein